MDAETTAETFSRLARDVPIINTRLHVNWWYGFCSGLERGCGARPLGPHYYFTPTPALLTVRYMTGGRLR